MKHAFIDGKVSPISYIQFFVYIIYSVKSTFRDLLFSLLEALLLHGVFEYRHFVQVFRCPDCSASQQMAVSLYPQSMTWTWPSSERPSRVLRNQALVLVTAHVAPLQLHTTHTSCQPPGLAARAWVSLSTDPHKRYYTPGRWEKGNNESSQRTLEKASLRWSISRDKSLKMGKGSGETKLLQRSRSGSDPERDQWKLIVGWLGCYEAASLLSNTLLSLELNSTEVKRICNHKPLSYSAQE